MKRIYTVLLFLAATLSSHGMDLPRKEGFSWWEIDTLKAAFLVPDGWHKKSTVRQDTLGYYITKEEILGGRGTFTTGLSLNVYKDFQAKRGTDPVRFIHDFQLGFSKHAKILKEWTRRIGPFDSYGFLSEGVVGGVSTKVHHLFIVNSKTGTLYYFFFEAPTSEFEEAWVWGEPMIKMLYIDDTI
ncbi:hypothetical protein [Coraliomargarita parva]|uniref:hypothetical protein n=1 Tax=Coraliomargarita parva TaxID=3014050 RepID=UPI0022B53DF7|nr:hypothetical protein [Coraliomargarita parva]